MPISVICRWLVVLAALLLLACGKKKDSNELQGNSSLPVASAPSRAESNPATAESAQAFRTLAILPPAATAADTLLAAFQGSAGQVEYRWEKNGQPLAGEESRRLAPEHFRKGDVIAVIVTNNREVHRAEISIGNLPPVVQRVSLQNPAIHRGVDIVLDVTGDDPDGDFIGFSYRWMRNGEAMEFVDGPVLSGDSFHRGDRISFLITPSDGETGGVPYAGSDIVIPNAPPVFFSQPPAQFTSNDFIYQVEAKDPDGDEIVYSLEDPPPGMTIQSRSGQISWDLSGRPAANYPVVVVATDSEEMKAYQEFNLNLARP